MSTDLPRPGRPRCAQHDLAIGPGGLCALCRRDSALAQPLVDEDDSFGADRVVRWLFGIALVLVLGAVALQFAKPLRAASPSSVRAASSLSLSAASALEPENSEARVSGPASRLETKPTQQRETSEADHEGQLEVSNAGDELESEPPSSPQGLAAAAADAKAVAERERYKLEEQERDRVRHEAVQRQLDQMSRAAARRDVTITMYSTSWCGVCKRARAYMQENSLRFTDYDVERDLAAQARYHAINPRGTVPTIMLDDDVMVGFTAQTLEAAIDRAAKKRTGP